jgi:hypothetical protein
MICHMCGHEFRVGDGYAFYRDDTERICKRCHAEWFGSKLHEEHIIQSGEIKQKTVDEIISECKHLIQIVIGDALGKFWKVCQECGRRIPL